MKRILIVILSVALFIPLYAQGDQPEKKPFSFARQHFEIGINAGGGFANDLLMINDVFQKDIIIDLDKLENSIQDDGANVKVDFLADFFINIKNIRMAGGLWDIGVFAAADGSLIGNLPKSMFTLISQGNKVQHSFSGMVSVSGGVYAETGLKTSAKYGKLRLGFTPALFSPVIYIPKSGINYVLDTEDGVSLRSNGTIDVYSPFIDDGEFNFSSDKLKYGFDVSLQGQYALFSFLDIGGVVSRVPVIPALLQNRMRITMSDVEMDISGQDLMDGNGLDLPDIDFEEEYDTADMKVYRPMRFDVYARFKPFFGTELIVLKPNLGFTVDIGDGEGYFNMGAEARLNLANIFIPYLSVNREEGLWTNRLGFALNFRVLELDLEAALQSQNFVDSFSVKGLSLNLGVRLGW